MIPLTATGDAASPQPVLASPRLLLAPIEPAHCTDLHALFSDPEAMRFMDGPPSRSLEETAKRAETYLFPLPIWHATWVLRERSGGPVIGLVNYHHRENWNNRLEIGFALRRSSWGKGFMREAIAALLDHCFGALDIHRVEATVNPDNQAAIRLLEALKFRFEGGPMRARQRVGGEFRDLSMYGLLRPEWRAFRRAAQNGLPQPPLAGGAIAHRSGAAA